MYIAVGCSNFASSNLHPRYHIHLFSSVRDPLSNNYLLVAFEDGAMALVDVDAAQTLSEFELQSQGLWIWLFLMICKL